MITIQLTKGQTATIDEADADLAQLNWCVHTNGYAMRKTPAAEKRAGAPPHILLHRVIAERMFGPVPPGKYVDHVDGNKRNDSRSNLRIVTPSESARNTKSYRPKKSQYRGVYWKEILGRWVATCSFNGRPRYIGTYDDEVAAARAYDSFLRTSGVKVARFNFQP